MFARSNWKQSRACSWCADVCSAEQVCFQETCRYHRQFAPCLWTRRKTNPTSEITHYRLPDESVGPGQTDERRRTAAWQLRDSVE